MKSEDEWLRLLSEPPEAMRAQQDTPSLGRTINPQAEWFRPWVRAIQADALEAAAKECEEQRVRPKADAFKGDVAVTMAEVAEFVCMKLNAAAKAIRALKPKEQS